MSLIIRKNKHTARIMHQQYVRKGSEGNGHGFVRQVLLATISLSATQGPAKISEIFSTKERVPRKATMCLVQGNVTSGQARHHPTTSFRQTNTAHRQAALVRQESPHLHGL